MIKFDPAIQFTHLPWSTDIMQFVADQLSENEAGFPDLSKVCLILSEGRAIHDCRLRLSKTAYQHGFNALIGPEIATLEQLAAATPLSGWNIISNSALQLILLDALKDHHYLYGKASPLGLANDLLQLFEQITRYDVQLPVDRDELFHRILNAYSNSNHQVIESRFADRESRLIHHIWQALKQQLSDEGKIDSASAFAAQLELLASKRTGWHFIFLGQEPLQSLEIHCLNLMSKNNRVDIVTYCSEGIDFYDEKRQAPYSDITKENFYDHLLLSQPAGPQLRKQNCLKHFPVSPIVEKIFIYACHSLEQEAQAIELQVLEWLQRNKTQIAFICNDRKLARRVRARLERHHIHFDDKSGWSLSTSRSATILELWLQCLESDFNYQAFLDLLKSPLMTKADEEKAWKTAVYAFEKNIVYIEQISSGLSRYQNACKDMLLKLPDSLHAPYRYMITILNKVQQAANILRPYIDGNHSPAVTIEALNNSLKSLECLEPLSRDHVGNIVVQLLSQLRGSAVSANIKCNWAEFRAWLGYNLEYERFNPPKQSSSVQLLTLEQSDLQEFDAIVIGGAQAEFLPGHKRASTFFNDAACRNLGLPDVKTQFLRSFHLFRRLLGFSERESTSIPMLLCHQVFDNQEPVQMCSWLEALQTNHHQIYAIDLSANYIDQWMSQLSQRHKVAPIAIHMSRANIAQALIPKTMSASAYQQLINCPYQFYAARALQLQVPELIKTYMEKSDYGELVHRCLYIFHFGIKGFAEAFSKPIDASNESVARTHLRHISDKVFSEAVGENFIHRAWRGKWDRCIDPYIDWLKTHSEEWRPLLGETSFKFTTRHGVSLTSTIDRIDEVGNGIRILDYKTGFIPKNTDVENGEAVQLPFYAMQVQHSEKFAANPIREVAFLKIDDGEVRLVAPLDTEQISESCEQHRQRIDILLKSISDGEEMAAWGDQTVCLFCDYQGLCRREYNEISLANDDGATA